MPSCLVNEEGNQQQVPLLYSIIAQLQRDAKTARTDLLSTSRVGEESQQLEKVGEAALACKSPVERALCFGRAGYTCDELFLHIQVHRGR